MVETEAQLGLIPMKGAKHASRGLNPSMDQLPIDASAIAPRTPIPDEFAARGSLRAGRNDLPLRLVGMSGFLLTADQVAEKLGVPKTWVYEQSRKGRIPTVTLGRYRRYRADAIERWVEQLEANETRV